MASEDEELLEGISDAVNEEAKSMSLSDVFATLELAKKQTDNRKSAEMVMSALSNLDSDSLDLLLESPEAKKLIDDAHARINANAKPGSPIFDNSGRQIGKVPYSYEYLCETFPVVEWTPMRTTPIGYNGVTIHVWAFETVKTPACFRDIYLNSEADTAKAFASAATVLRDSNYGAADGISFVAGETWRKPTDAELEKMYGPRS